MSLMIKNASAQYLIKAQLVQIPYNQLVIYSANYHVP